MSEEGVRKWTIERNARVNSVSRYFINELNPYKVFLLLRKVAINL